MKPEEKAKEVSKSGRELCLLLLSLFFWLFLGPVVSLALGSLSPFQSDLGAFVLLFIPYLFLFLTLLLGSHLLLKKPLTTLVGKAKGQGLYLSLVALLYLGITAVFTFLGSTTLERTTYPGKERLLFLLPALFLVSIQTFSEEMFFRVLPARIIYQEELPQGWKMLPLSIGSGIFFTLPHLANPEVLTSDTALFAIFYYFLWGAMAMALGLSMQSFWVTITMHTVNNLFVALVVNYEHSALPSKALYLNHGDTSSLKQLVILVSLFLAEAVFTYVYRRATTEKKS